MNGCYFLCMAWTLSNTLDIKIQESTKALGKMQIDFISIENGVVSQWNQKRPRV
jgi:uncharacterized protein (UPF0212 family)